VTVRHSEVKVRDYPAVASLGILSLLLKSTINTVCPLRVMAGSMFTGAHPFPFCVFVIVVSLLVSCDETLPPRNEPRQFLVTSAAGVDGTLTYREGVFEGSGGTILMHVRNTYDEVLQEEERIRGDVEVWMRDMPEKRATIHATKANLTNPGLVYAGMVTLGPDTTASLLKRWEHRATVGSDSGHFFWEFVDSTLKVNSRGESYYESAPVHFVGNARVQIFKNVQPVTIRHMEFTVVYLRF
jgi:hypothetical protein